MDTPIVDFIRRYQSSSVARLHMPGHKGAPLLGMESWDITEIHGADALYEADGIIAKSEQNASALFGTQKTLYSTEGSSQCIRAMLHLALACRAPGTSRTILAARNVHKAFVYAAALLDFDVVWLWPEASNSICACPVTAKSLEAALGSLPAPPAAVYITTPDYLGNMADVRALSDICHAHGTLLLADNAHGAYLRFLTPSCHPMDLGADLCCDSAHKTLPVLTGGAYLHISRRLPKAYAEKAKAAMALFGSTSPSYLTLASLDACNQYLTENYSEKLRAYIACVKAVKAELSARGWQVEKSDPLRITLRAFPGMSGQALAEHLRKHGAECEYADRDHLVLMVTPENRAEDLGCLLAALSSLSPAPAQEIHLPMPVSRQVVSIREAVMGASETIPACESVGRICASPLVACPPAIPIVVSGEVITQDAVALLDHYGIGQIEVLV